MQVIVCVLPRLSFHQASHVAASVNGSLRRAMRRAVVDRRERCRRKPTTTRTQTPQALPPHQLNPLRLRRSSMLPLPSRRTPSAVHLFLSPKRALRVMKGKHVENAVTLPSSATARVSNAIRAVGRAVVVKSDLISKSHPIGGM